MNEKELITWKRVGGMGGNFYYGGEFVEIPISENRMHPVPKYSFSGKSKYYHVRIYENNSVFSRTFKSIAEAKAFCEGFQELLQSSVMAGVYPPSYLN